MIQELLPLLRTADADRDVDMDPDGDAPLDYQNDVEEGAEEFIQRIQKQRLNPRGGRGKSRKHKPHPVSISADGTPARRPAPRGGGHWKAHEALQHWRPGAPQRRSAWNGDDKQHSEYHQNQRYGNAPQVRKTWRAGGAYAH